METFTLVPDIPNPIVECHNLNLPPIDGIEFKHKPGYDTSDGYKRYLGTEIGPNDPKTLHFENMMRGSVLPLLHSHPRFYWSWPIKLEALLDQVDIKVSLVKDEVGFSQPKHEDPRIYVVSGILHLQDCEQGTYFTDGNYTAPTKKFSGAFWSNSQWSQHLVPKVTSERLAYLVMAQWKFLDGYYPK